MQKLKEGLWIDEAQHEIYKSFLEKREKAFEEVRWGFLNYVMKTYDNYDASSIDKQNPYGKED